MHSRVDMKRTAPLWLAAAATVSAACGAGRASFQPTENVRATGRGGQPAASYDVEIPGGAVAHVNVWSEGAYRAANNRTIASVALEIRNTGEETLVLDRRLVRLEAFTGEGQPIRGARLVSLRTDGPPTTTIPPAQASTINLYFALPVPIDPGDVGSLRLRWGLRYDGSRYVQFTDFQRERPETYAGGGMYAPVYGMYDPWLYGSAFYHRPYFVPVRRVYVAPRTRPDSPRPQVSRRR